MHQTRPTFILTASYLLGVGFLAILAGCSSRDGGKGDNTEKKPRINGGGSSFVYVMMTKWTKVYETEKGGQINYQSIGSGGGIQKFMSKEFEFGCSDAPLNEEQLEKAKKTGDVVHVPICHGAVVAAYNLSEITEPLKLTGPILAEIFLRKIRRWNDDQIKALNPTLADKLPAKDIVVVHRSDGSGTTFVFADYLAKVSPEWKKTVGVSTSVKWDTDTIGAKGNEGVAGQIKNNPGAIGYVELAYALQNKIEHAILQNKDGQFVRGSLEGTTAAADASLSEIPEDLRFSITDPPGKESYPICGTVWAIIWTDQSGAKGKETVQFLRWVTKEDGGQKYCKDLHYAPLPKGLVERVERALSKTKVDG